MMFETIRLANLERIGRGVQNGLSDRIGFGHSTKAFDNANRIVSIQATKRIPVD